MNIDKLIEEFVQYAGNPLNPQERGILKGVILKHLPKEEPKGPDKSEWPDFETKFVEFVDVGYSVRVGKRQVVIREEKSDLKEYVYVGCTKEDVARLGNVFRRVYAHLRDNEG